MMACHLYEGNEYLEEDRIKDSVEYLDDFYEMLDDQGKMRREFTEKCRR